MRTKQVLGIAVFAVFFMIACKKEKDDSNYGASVAPLAAGVNADAGVLEFWGDGPYATGTYFTSAKNGRITHLGVLSGKGSYVVALWDSTAQSVVVSTTITVTDSTRFTYADIADVNIQGNKVYIIATNNRKTTGTDGYYAYKELTTLSYPMVFGDITLLKECEVHSTDPLNLFPHNIRTDNFAGIADFKFQPEL